MQMSAWLKHSIDSFRGNNKKSEKYWTYVQKEYNQVTIKNRWRTTKQLKIDDTKLINWQACSMIVG